ncbi:hypothetical protein C8R44DRAFT_876488 [Mycena epipterygia]|nr:hypothetical protein C8R44DRAFT_876488 [Mycena epipterygia]
MNVGRRVQLFPRRCQCTLHSRHITDFTAALLPRRPQEGVPASFLPLTHMDPPPTGATTDQIHKYAPVVIGLLATNLLGVLILTIVGLTLCVRRGGMSGTRTPQHIAVKLRNEESQESVGYQDRLKAQRFFFSPIGTV